MSSPDPEKEFQDAMEVFNEFTRRYGKKINPKRKRAKRKEDVHSVDYFNNIHKENTEDDEYYHDFYDDGNEEEYQEVKQFRNNLAESLNHLILTTIHTLPSRIILTMIRNTRINYPEY